MSSERHPCHVATSHLLVRSTNQLKSEHTYGLPPPNKLQDNANISNITRRVPPPVIQGRRTDPMKSSARSRNTEDDVAVLASPCYVPHRVFPRHACASQDHAARRPLVWQATSTPTRVKFHSPGSSFRVAVPRGAKATGLHPQLRIHS